MIVARVCLFVIGLVTARSAFFKVEGQIRPLSVNAVAFSPGGRHGATGGDDQNVRLWEVSSGALVWSASAVR
jgi:WD40 repeat protein